MMRRLFGLCLLLTSTCTWAQETFPVNGSLDKRPGQFAFTHGTIVLSPDQTIEDGTLLIKGDKITGVGVGVNIPAGYVVVDLKGKYIYPSLIDAFSTYGTQPDAPAVGRTDGMISTKKGPFAWNEAIRPESSVRAAFSVDQKKAEELSKLGFGIVHSINRNGIARGTSAIVTLQSAEEGMVILKDEAAANFSFNKGTSRTAFPESLMGAIALLRQIYNDARWYAGQKDEYNLSLAEFSRQLPLPGVFDVDNWQNILRADKIGDEFGKQYIFKTGGDEYQRIDLIKATNGSLIVPLQFPKAFDVEDPAAARMASYAQLKHWELAPANPAVLEKAGVRFALTATGLESTQDFWTNLRLALQYGLSEKQAFRALTTIPAALLGIDDRTGTLAQGKLANFLICSGNIFSNQGVIYENWIRGTRTVANRIEVSSVGGKYNLNLDRLGAIQLELTDRPDKHEVMIRKAGPDSLNAKGSLTRNGDQLSFYIDAKGSSGVIRFEGIVTAINPLSLNGQAVWSDGSQSHWTATYAGPSSDKPSPPKAVLTASGKTNFPFGAYGWTDRPTAKSVLFKDATVWTNESAGKLLNTDVWIEGGKIKAIGKNLSAPNATVVNATGKHISAGIIDEHSHICIAGNGNEGTQSVTSEVRIADVIDPEDITVYRQLAGGVTSSHVLHGSANSIGGQTQIIKLRWGRAPEEMKFEGAPGFIKFALGENVKQSNWGPPIPVRFPQTRMGTEQVFADAFTRAKKYRDSWNSFMEIKTKIKGLVPPRKDLEMEALAEILDGKRFITCHSYVQSEIDMMMHLADSMGFRINTFTHIMEGYKVADKMKDRKIAGGTFSDWWGYKMEVAEATPYNGRIMHDVGVLVAFNSDDPEVARHLNQEAAKAIKYGGMSEEEALKLVTLNPAKILHIDNRVGSLAPGKDADVVLWSGHPLSIYARAEKTFVDGIEYWDSQRDAVMQQEMAAERSRLVLKMLEAKKSGAKTTKVVPVRDNGFECEEWEMSKSN